MSLQDIIQPLSAEDRLKIVELLERFSQSFILSDLWENTLPLDAAVRQLVEEELVPDFLTEVYGAYDPKLMGKDGREIGIGDTVLLDADRKGFVVGLDPASGVLDIETEESDTEVVLSAQEVILYDAEQ